MAPGTRLLKPHGAPEECHPRQQVLPYRPFQGAQSANHNGMKRGKLQHKMCHVWAMHAKEENTDSPWLCLFTTAGGCRPQTNLNLDLLPFPVSPATADPRALGLDLNSDLYHPCFQTTKYSHRHLASLCPGDVEAGRRTPQGH